MRTLTVTLVQKASGLDPAENLATLDDVVAEAFSGSSPRPDLVVLPEVFMRDFGKPGSDIGAFAEDLDGPFVRRLQQKAQEYDVTLVAGMFERSEDPTRPYNTLVVVDGSGLRATYRKIHLYDSFGYKESDRLLAGALEPVTVDLDGVRLGLMTCYDLRFPELARALVTAGAELLVVPAAGVAGPGKADHWTTLARARAIENTVYVAAAGQPGPRYTGHSMVVSPRGEVLTAAGEEEALVTAVVDGDELEAARAENPSLLNRRL